MLAVLPPGIRCIHLNVPCAGPLLVSLLRFQQLQQVDLTGNGAEVAWHGRGSKFVLPKLASLKLDYQKKMEWDLDEPIGPAETQRLPGGIAAALAPATNLRSLELCVRCTDGLHELCQALPALQELRWGRRAVADVLDVSSIIFFLLPSPRP